MDRAQTQVQKQTRHIKPISNFRTAISLHSHTFHSRESLDFLPHYLKFHQIPVVSQLAESEMRRYEERHGKPVNFASAYWTPPVSPEMLLASETVQIENKLGLAAIVSMTDHDTIRGPLSLQGKPGAPWTPVSVEWSIPFAGNCVHVGVHNLPLANAGEVMRMLSGYTAKPDEETLAALFALLDSSPETLLVLNHPLCNFVRVGPKAHWASLRRFLAQCGPWIHALELNGMRPWEENQDVLRLAEEYDLPVVSGGDRHGCRPNTMLNLSDVQNWNDYVAQIRCDRRSDILALPAYEEPVQMRELATACDVIRDYPHYPHGQRRYTDRIYAELEGRSDVPLSLHWKGGKGMPPWLPPVVATVLALGSDPVRPVLQMLFSIRGEYDNRKRASGSNYGSESMTAQTEGTAQ